MYGRVVVAVADSSSYRIRTYQLVSSLPLPFFHTPSSSSSSSSSSSYYYYCYYYFYYYQIFFQCTSVLSDRACLNEVGMVVVAVVVAPREEG